MKNSFALKLGTIAISAATILTAASCSAKTATDSAYLDPFSEQKSTEYSGGSIFNTSSASAPMASGNRGSYNFDTADSDASLNDGALEYNEETANMEKYGERKIIYSSWYNISTEEYDKSIDMLNAMCEKYGAYYENSESYGGDGYSDRYAHFTVRIPKENYNSFIREAGGIGTVTSSGENNREVTEQYFDTEARLQSARLREERLLQILENAGSLDDVLLLERELSDVRYEIENYSGTLKKFDSLISYSTADITVNEVVKVVLPDSQRQGLGERMSLAISRGFDSFRDDVGNFLVNLSYEMPVLLFVWLPLAVIAALVVVFILRKHKKKKQNNIDVVTETMKNGSDSDKDAPNE